LYYFVLPFNTHKVVRDNQII